MSVNHSETYVADGDVHTNGVENVWSLFKRAITGTFHKVSAKYLPLYLNEFAYRFNNRDELQYDGQGFGNELLKSDTTIFRK